MSEPLDLQAIDTAPVPPPAPDGAPPAPAVAAVAPPGASPFYSSLPEDWRVQAVTGAGVKDVDAEKMAKHLERYTDLPNALKAGYEAANKIRQGLVSNGLPENPTPEELATYREAHGIPADGKYALTLAEGLALSDEDQAIMEDVFKAAHGNNVPAKALSEITSSFLAARVKAAEMIEQNDLRDEREGQAKLKQEWGRDYEPNLNACNNLLNRLPQETLDQLLDARSADGKKLVNNIEFVSFLADLERKVNPQATIMQNSGGAVQTRDARIQALEAKMRDRDSWFKDSAAQEELRSLYANKEKYG